MAHVVSRGHHVEMRIRSISALLITAALLSSSIGGAQTRPTPPPPIDSIAATTAPLLGDVVDAVGRPLADVEIFLAGTDFTTRTDARGFWIFPDPPRGARVLGARALGYAPIIRAINISSRRPDTIPLALRKLPRTLSTVKVQATYDGAKLDATAMAERIMLLRVSTGKLYTRDSILSRNPQSMVDLLMGIPGIIARREQQGFSVFATRQGLGTSSTPGSGCPMQFFVNRAPVDVEFVASMSPMQWQSVEVHPLTAILSGLPMVSGSCGAIIITMM